MHLFLVSGHEKLASSNEMVRLIPTSKYKLNSPFFSSNKKQPDLYGKNHLKIMFLSLFLLSPQ